MRRLRILIAALALATCTWQAHALSITVDADLLKDASGNPMATNGLVLLVASTTDSTFNDPTPLSFVSGDDIIVGKWDLRSWGEPGVLIDFTNTTTVLSSANPLRLYWYPTLDINATAPGQNTPYGVYRDTADPSQQATATATLSGSSIGSINLTYGGGTYHSAPTVTFTNGGGSGATATATISGGVVTAINLVNPGSGYTNPPDILVSAPAANDSSAAWFGANASSSINLRFITTDADPGFHTPGSNPSSAGLASSNTPTAIVINSQPANAAQNYGGTATFSVTATGTSLVYKWRKNGVNLSDTGNVSGSSTTSLTLSSVTASDSASYSVFITNSSAFVTSSNATLTVTDPLITTPPSSSTVNAAGTASFSVVAVGSGTLTYQWKKGGSTLSNGTQGSGAVVSGATTSAVTISGVQQPEANSYTVLVTGTGGTTTSSAATLTVTGIAPVFSTPSADSTSTLGAGDTITLSAVATGSNPITYQWKKGVSNLSNGAFANGATVSGAATGTLTLTGVMASDAGVYVCDAHNGTGDTLSHTTTINVNDPIISVQPGNITAECGSVSACLSVTAVGSTNLTYQWYSPDPSGTVIANATNATLCFNNISFANAGNYSVVVSNVYGSSITSSVATVTLTDITGPDVIINGTSPTNICQGTPYTELGATATDLCDGPLLASPSGNVDTNTVGSYTITYTATDSHSNTGTAIRVVNVQNCGVTDPEITSQPANQTVVTGQKNFTMSVTVAGTPSSNPKLAGSGGFRYQWFHIPTNSTVGKIIGGATNATLLFKTAASFGNAGTYYCYVTNAINHCSSDPTNFGHLTVYAAPAVGALPHVTKIAGNIAVFKAIASPSYGTRTDLGGPFTYVWKKNGSVISTGGNITISNNGRYSSLIIDNIQSVDGATYSCTVGNSSAATATTPNTDGLHGLLTVNPEVNPSVAILHPSPNLHYTNGLASLNTGSTPQPGNFAPDLDIDGLASDSGRITDVTLIRLQDTNIYHSPFVYRTNSSGAMQPGRVRWTNHVTLLDGTNTFQAFATNTANLFASSTTTRTYYMCTPVTVTINVVGSGKIISLAGPFGKAAQGVNSLFNKLPYKVAAAAVGSGKHFLGWTDGNSVAIPGTSTLAFTATNNMVINANFTP